MNNMFTALKKAMYNYNNLDLLTPRKRQAIVSTYSKFANDYTFVETLVGGSEEDENEEE